MNLVVLILLHILSPGWAKSDNYNPFYVRLKFWITIGRYGKLLHILLNISKYWFLSYNFLWRHLNTSEMSKIWKLGSLGHFSKIWCRNFIFDPHAWNAGPLMTTQWLVFQPWGKFDPNSPKTQTFLPQIKIPTSNFFKMYVWTSMPIFRSLAWV